MKLSGARVLLTGAAGGIGREIAMELGRREALLVLADRNSQVLHQIQEELGVLGCQSHIVVCDLATEDAPQSLASQASSLLGGIDLLINCAGISSFSSFIDESPQALELLWRINVLVPMQLTKELLPQMLKRGSGQIANIGSIFGSIGFAYFTAYSASKFAIRGFSDSLRREVDGSGVGVTYIAPRFTKTALNTDLINRMAKAVGMNGDDPHTVAHIAVRAIEQDKQDCYIGWPESLFVRINALFPRLVDAALRKQSRQMHEFAVTRSN